uniref:Uncharacterized protein n=1 Tax=Nymphaea colorata TaxID=210225 RepID=A0A5K1B956_9MAGN
MLGQSLVIDKNVDFNLHNKWTLVGRKRKKSQGKGMEVVVSQNLGKENRMVDGGGVSCSPR